MLLLRNCQNIGSILSRLRRNGLLVLGSVERSSAGQPRMMPVIYTEIAASHLERPIVEELEMPKMVITYGVTDVET